MSYAAEVARLVTRYTPEDREALRVFQREHFGSDSRHSNDEFFRWLFDVIQTAIPRAPRYGSANATAQSSRSRRAFPSC